MTRIFTAIAAAPGVTREQLAELAGVSVTSSHLVTGLKHLAQRRLIVADSNSHSIAGGRT